MSSTLTFVRFSGATPQPATSDVSVARVRIFDTSVWMTYRRDEAEWSRRCAQGLGGVLAWDLLDTLMDLPAGQPVPLATLSAPVQRRLLRAPRGVVTVVDGAVTRDVVPPLTPLLAVVTSRGWDKAMVAASRFAAYCPRMVVVSEIPGDATEALRTAEMYGIGVALGRTRPTEVVLEPEALTDWQPTPAWWRFTERIYDQVVTPTTEHAGTQTVADPTSTGHAGSSAHRRSAI